MTGEFAWIERLRARFPAIGDDCAAVEPPNGALLLASDALVGGVDFTAASPLADVGWNAVVANVSDVAAMGGRPLWLVVAVCAPAGTALDVLADGLAEGAAAHDCEVVGGDLSATDGPLVVSVAITGVVDLDGPGPVWRTGATAGDAVWVTGPLGAAAATAFAGRRHPARVAEGVAARQAGATAMIDISDGLVADLEHVLRASGVGVALDDVPVADGATLDYALAGGEDYELLFTLSPSASAPPGAIRIGSCTADPATRTLRDDPLPPAAGFEHDL
jgi:thiamine-monophosphate kinase